MNQQIRYLSRNQTYNFFGGYTVLPFIVRRTLKALFKEEGEPRKFSFNGSEALIFDRNPERPKKVLIQLDDMFGLFTVNDDLTIHSGKEFLKHSRDTDWRNLN